ncbi:MAG TPA: ANTAR domain-containing protein [Bryobacteraceae bacterium]|nr:ANTAR domain-containing protein [Bryobacteraceae bacterium]
MRSLQPLAMIAAREAKADGCAMHQFDAAGERQETFSWGVQLPEGGATGFTVASFPLGAEEASSGVLTFVFRGAMISPRAQALLERMAAVIEEAWRLTEVPVMYARSAARIGELETALADSKIADRARGLLANHVRDTDAIDTIVGHVESVLRPSQLRTALDQRTKEIEQELAEREMAARAKAVLQKRYGMSEDQAHVHLRLVSRQSRKRLRDVARDVLAR